MSKPVIALYDVHTLDEGAYRAGLGEEFELIFIDQPLLPATVERAAHAQVVSVHVTSQVSAEVMAAIPGLAHVACRTTGYDNVDLAYAKAHHVSVSTVPAYGQSTVAEYAILMLLAVTRRIMLAAHSVHAGTIVPEKLTGTELFGKTLGVIGTGRIGQHAATIAKGFGMKLLAYDPYPNQEAAAKIGFTYHDLPELLAQSDMLTLHAPATPETHHLLGKEQFEHMKHGMFIVNTARGTLIDTPALVAALESGVVAGAGLDVLEGEEYLQLEPELHLLGKAELGDEAREVLGIEILHKMPNVLITSHNAYNSVEALERIRQTTIENINAWHRGEAHNLVADPN